MKRNFVELFKPVVIVAAAVTAFAGVSHVVTAQTETATHEPRVAMAEIWWRIRMYELDHGKWRYAGSFENPDRGRVVRYGDSWNEGKRGYRTYSPPEAFKR